MQVLYWLFIVLICLILALEAIINVFFWLATKKYPCKELPAPPSGLKFVLELYARTILSHFTAILLHPTGWSMRAVKLAGRRKNSPPLLLIHGIYKNPSSWFFMQRTLQKAGFITTTFSYHSFFTSLDEIMCSLETAVSGLESEYPGQKPLIIAHSLGGVLTRLWLKKSGNSKRLSGLITLGTPQHGSEIARLAPGQLVKNLVPGSELLSTLNVNSTALDFSCVSIVSPSDELVWPADSLLPPAGWKLVTVKPCTHFELLLLARNIKIVLQELEEIIPQESSL